MRTSRKVQIVVLAVLAVVVVIATIVGMSLRTCEESWVGFHQRSVTRSLAAWGRETARITNDASAIHAAEMVAYMNSYYVPGPGYHGPAKVEIALERQRRESIAQVVAALEHYSGLEYGTNVKRWTKWAEAQKSSELGVAANGSQPFRSETNRTSSTAGSRR